MIEKIICIIFVAFIGGLLVPVILLFLARFGYFEPIQFNRFGRLWKFMPPKLSPLKTESRDE